MSRPLTVLCVEAAPGDALDVRRDLQQAGHRVLGCHAAAAPGNACRLLTSGECVLDDGDVDAAVDVRRRGLPGIGEWERGLICAQRAGVPVVLLGSAPSRPPFDLADARSSCPGDAVALVETAVSRPGTTARRTVARALGRAARVTGHPDRFRVALVERAGVWDVVATTTHRPDELTHRALVAAARSALAAYTPEAGRARLSYRISSH